MFKKILLGTTFAAGITVPIAVAMTSVKDKSMTFWNYEDYMNEDNQNQLTKEYGYSQFGDLPELGQAIKDNSVVAGVGSDYYNVQLINDGLIKKIDFNALYGYPETGAALETKVKALYTDAAWKLMESFTDKIKAGKGKLWEYMIPYFIQNKVIAYRVDALQDPTDPTADLTALTALKGTDQTDIQNVFASDMTWTGIMTKLKSLMKPGRTHLAINNYMRDNLMIGSENGNLNNFSSDLNDSNYKSQISGFKNVINGWNSQFIDSGADTLNSLIDNNEDFKADVAFLYNGDALDAFYGSDNFEPADDSKDGLIRTITPGNSSLLLDGIVIPSYIDDDQDDKVLTNIRNILYTGFDATTDTEFEEGMMYNNFDYVNYSHAFKSGENNVKNSYFASDAGASADEVAINDYGKTISLATSNAVVGKSDAEIKRLATLPISSSKTTIYTDAYNNAFGLN